jgi:hypothetical protein
VLPGGKCCESSLSSPHMQPCNRIDLQHLPPVQLSASTTSTPPYAVLKQAVALPILLAVGAARSAELSYTATAFCHWLVLDVAVSNNNLLQCCAPLFLRPVASVQALWFPSTHCLALPV